MAQALVAHGRDNFGDVAGAIDELGESSTVLTVEKTDDAARSNHLQMVVFGTGTFATHALPDVPEVVIGRSSGCDVKIDDESISRRHAVLKLGEQLSIEDLGSANGTTVRGERIAPNQPTPIAVGELIALGKASIILQHRSRSVRARRLWTHDYFEARLEEECARAERSGTAFAVLRLRVNTGAPAAYIEETLTELVRESDVIGTYGPHDYEVLLPETSPREADDIVRRVEATLRGRGMRTRLIHATYPRDGRSAHQLLARLHVRPTEDAAPVKRDAEVIVSDPQMQSLHRLVEQVAVSPISVLLLGETGVGKEVFAQALHRASPRASGPFVEINCAALTETLLESELFGHEKGAFTHAQAAKPGLLELADGGTLLLDEVGDMPLGIQAKLLRVLESSELRRVGGTKTKTIDVRFVAATNADLENQVAAGTFRRDLFYRLNGVTIVIPPLRERLAELEPLAEMFIARAWTKHAPAPALAADALALMRKYSWPGNIRELKHMMERAVLLCGDGPIKTEHLPAEKLRMTVMTSRRAPSDLGFVIPPRRTPEEEQQRIVEALERCGGNQTLAARLLGISRRTLVNRLDEYQLERPRKKKK